MLLFPAAFPSLRAAKRGPFPNLCPKTHPQGSVGPRCHLWQHRGPFGGRWWHKWGKPASPAGWEPSPAALWLGEGNGWGPRTAAPPPTCPQCAQQESEDDDDDEEDEDDDDEDEDDDDDNGDSSEEGGDSSESSSEEESEDGDEVSWRGEGGTDARFGGGPIAQRHPHLQGRGGGVENDATDCGLLR